MCASGGNEVQMWWMKEGQGRVNFSLSFFLMFFGLKWFDWPKVSFEQVISTISIFTA
jgi:hypothetical protein